MAARPHAGPGRADGGAELAGLLPGKLGQSCGLAWAMRRRGTLTSLFRAGQQAEQGRPLWPGLPVQGSCVPGQGTMVRPGAQAAGGAGFAGSA